MSDRRTRLHALSEVLFGQKWRLEVMITVARMPADADITLTGLAEALQIVNASKIQTAVDRLKEARLLEEIPGTGRDKPLRRGQSKVWDWVLEYDVGDEQPHDLRLIT